MSKRYTTIDGLFGTKIHLDENGNYAGESVPGLFNDTMIHYDANGNYAGRTDPGLFGTRVHTDKDGRAAGESVQGWLGQMVHSGTDGKTGTSWDTWFGTVTEIDGD